MPPGKEFTKQPFVYNSSHIISWGCNQRRVRRCFKNRGRSDKNMG